MKRILLVMKGTNLDFILRIFIYICQGKRSMKRNEERDRGLVVQFTRYSTIYTTGTTV